MSILKTLIGGDTVSAVEAVGNVADNLFTSDDERLTHTEIRTRLAQKPHLAQIELNKVEARHRTVFVAGWRPAIGWVCALGLVFAYIVNPILQWRFGVDGPPLPMEHINTLLWGMLGLGGLRTIEKTRGRAK